MVCLVAASLNQERVISSSARRESVVPILAASAWVLGVTATRYSALGYSGAGSVSGWPLSHRVSPVPVSLSLGTAKMSPACTVFTGICSLPRMMARLPMRSSISFFGFHTRLSEVNTPE